MAPLPIERLLPPRSAFKLPPRPPQSVVAARGFARLRILVYILLATSAISGLAILFWRSGVLLRYFTLGRILRDRKLVDTRYIKRWYGWVPQDRYNSRRQIRKRLFSKIHNWFLWDNCVDYSRIWWDPICAIEEKHHVEDTGWKPLTDSVASEKVPDMPQSKGVASSISKSQEVASGPISVPRNVLRVGNPINICHSPSRASMYHTVPLCLRIATISPRTMHNPICSLKQDSETLQTSPKKAARLSKQTPIDFEGSTRGQPGYHIRSSEQQLIFIREWAARLEMGSLSCVFPHHSGLLGRPGTPVTGVCSSSYQYTQLQDSSKSGESSRLFTMDSTCDIPKKEAHRVSISCRACQHCTSYLSEDRYKPVAWWRKTSACEDPSKILDVETRFFHKVDKGLGWLLNECQPGHRGSKYATLPRNWFNNQKWLEYTHPCCASIELMRRYGGGQHSAQQYEDPDVFQKKSTRVRRRRLRAASIESWREAVNRARRRMDIAVVHSNDLFVSSAENPPDTTIDPADWMLRRPPQGFGISKGQSNAYYYGGNGKWAKLDDWQTSDDCYVNQNGFLERCSVAFAISEKSRWTVQQHSAEIVCP